MAPYEEELKATKDLGLKLIDRAHVDGEISDDEFDKLWIMISKGHDWMIRACAYREGFKRYMKEKEKAEKRESFHKYMRDKKKNEKGE